VAFHYEPPFLELEIYRLITLLEASPELAKFEGSDSDKRQLDFLRRLFEFSEISRIVVSLAAIHRTALNADPRYYAAVHKAALQRGVGTLIADQTKPQKQKPLDFREACNKVLHADQVDPETDPASGALTGRLILLGELNEKEWCVELDLRAYALTALALSP
jgi:hypothetical protein